MITVQLKGVVCMKSMLADDSLIVNVNDMLGSATFLEINDLLKQSSMFTLVGRTHTERWHSAAVAWLLNPDSNHGLGNFPLRRFLMAACICANRQMKPPSGLPSLAEIVAADFEEVSIMPDLLSDQYCGEKTVKVDNEKCSFDVAATTLYAVPGVNRRKLLLIIENKIKHSESKDQTERYAKWAWESPHYPINDEQAEQNSGRVKFSSRVLVFLTPLVKGARALPKDPRFIPMSYQDLYDGVFQSCLCHPRLSVRGKMLLNEFCDTLVDSDYIITARELRYSENLRNQYGVVLNRMIEAYPYSSLAKGEDSAESKGTRRVTLTDLFLAGFLVADQKLICKLCKEESQVTVVTSCSGSENDQMAAFLRVERDGKMCDTPSGAAVHIMGGGTYPGWDCFFTIEADGKRKTLAEIRDAYRKSLDEKPKPVDQQTADYVAGVFQKYKVNFQFIERLVQLEDDSFQIPEIFKETPKSNYDYSRLSKVLGGGVVKAYFKNHPAETFSLDLTGAAMFMIEGEEMSGLKATRFMAEKTGQTNASSSYQWARYWYVSEGKHKGKSFWQVFETLENG